MARIKQAVIVVGGMGTRLMPLTKYRPKPILPVLNKPCLRYLIESFAGSGIEEVILACGYRSPQFKEAIGDGSDLGITIDYSYEDEPMGTGGAMKLVEDRLDDVYAAANGDVFADMSLGDQISTHFSCRAEVTIALTTVDNPCEFGIARVSDDGEIKEFKEKPKPEEVFSNLINAGIYIINRSALSYVPEGTFFDFSKDLLPALMRDKKKIQGYQLNGLWRDVGRPADLLWANMRMASKLYDGTEWGGNRTRSTAVKKPFYLGKGASVIGSDAYAAVVMENSAVTDSKLMNALIMKDCVIDSAKIENSIIGEGCRVGRGAEIISSVVGDGMTIEAGRKIIEERVCL
ncbi:MAG: NDP-sugar synthase [Candidatus Methanoplasma sp.]|nr:NDP-sugar synthase [Candidatus Methanoplasma sp.]